MITAIELMEKYFSLIEMKCKPGFKLIKGVCTIMGSKEKRNRSIASKKAAGMKWKNKQSKLPTSVVKRKKKLGGVIRREVAAKRRG